MSQSYVVASVLVYLSKHIYSYTVRTKRTISTCLDPIKCDSISGRPKTTGIWQKVSLFTRKKKKKKSLTPVHI